jgi:phosphatidylserine decarboxylase
MSKNTITRAVPEPLPANITSVQPGSGVCYRVELAWGRWRRWYLKTFRRGYVQRMAQLRTGSTDGAPHEILDPRDLKFTRNLCTADWAAKDDPFRWRSKLGFARWGLCELMMMSLPLLAVTLGIIFGARGIDYPNLGWLAIVPGVFLVLIVWFFRNPSRRIPTEPGLVVSPADGKIVEITPLAHHDFVGGPAVKIGIFLSIFNVHINRAPMRGRVIKLHYSPGKFINAQDPESAIVNENLWVGFEEEELPHRKFVVRQISGLLARRIVCELRPCEVVERGAPWGMIKLGSRTELILPSDGLDVTLKPGQMVSAGTTIMARYATTKAAHAESTNGHTNNGVGQATSTNEGANR